MCVSKTVDKCMMTMNNINKYRIEYLWSLVFFHHTVLYIKSRHEWNSTNENIDPDNSGSAKNENKGQLIDIIKRKLSSSVCFMWLVNVYILCIWVMFLQQKHGLNVHVRGERNEWIENRIETNQSKQQITQCISSVSIWLVQWLKSVSCQQSEANHID